MNYLICLRDLEYGGTPTFYVSLARELVGRGHKVVFASSGGPLQGAIKPICHHRTFSAFGRESSMAYVISNRLMSEARRAVLVHLYPDLADALRIERKDLKYVIHQVARRSQAKVVLHERCRGTLGLVASVPKLRQIIDTESIDAVFCSQASPTLIACLASHWARSQPVFVPVVAGFSVCGDLFPPLGWQQVTRSAHRVVALTHEIGVHLVNLAGVPQSKLVVAPNAIDTQRFQPWASSDDLRSELGIPPQDQVIVHVSSLVSQALPMALSVVEAFEQVLRACRDTTLAIVGGGNAFGEVEKRASTLNQSQGRSAIIMLGNQDTLLPGILSMGKLAIGVGRCAREAMACGRPVIVSGLTGYAGVVSEENIEKVAATNFTGRRFDVAPKADRLAADIINLLRNEHRCDELGSFSRGYIETHDSIEMAADLFQLLATGN